MAFWHRRGKRVYVYVYHDGKQRTLPRAQVSHLDYEPDHNVDFWVREWEGKRVAPPPAADAHFIRLVKGFITYAKARGKSIKTLDDYEKQLTSNAMAYFWEEHGVKDANEWPSVSAKFTDWMRERGRSEETIRRTNTALRGLWDWLRDERLVLSGSELRLRPALPRMTLDQDTPLTRIVGPDEILEFARDTQRRVEIRLMALIGYFFSLRPQEVFALQPRDFIGGSAAALLESGKKMAQLGLFARLAVRVKHQRVQNGELTPPKKGSRGWVSCFDAAAARLLSEELAKLDPDLPIFGPWKNDWWFTLWRREGIPGVTLKDLRRASCYWLGHNTRFAEEPVAAMKHMRHTKLDTTFGYLRRPGESPAEWTLDLDA